MKNIIIGIQARSTSTRLPDKMSFNLGDMKVIEHVIERCENAAKWLNRQEKLNINADVHLLIPRGDKLKTLKTNCEIHEGSEPDVLSRYIEICEKYYPDYICRITGDCPLIPEYVVSSIIKMAALGNHDYTSNTIPMFRTSIDGHDCEVMSNKMVQWLKANAVEDIDREHVTTRIMKDPPKWASIQPVIGYYDLSQLKISVDTQDDMDFIKNQFKSVQDKITSARKYGYKVGRL